MANSLTFENMEYFGSAVLAQLKKKLAILGLVNASFGNEAGAAGDTINVNFLNVSGASRTRSKGGAVTMDDLSSGTRAITLSHIYKAVQMDNLDRTFASFDVMMQAAQRVGYSVAEGVSALLMGQWYKIPHEVGELDGTAAFNSTDKLTHLSSARKRLIQNGSLTEPLYGLLGPSEAHNFRILAENFQVNTAGGSGVRERGELGQVYGVNLFETQQVESSTLTTAAAWSTAPLVDLVAGYAIGDTSIHVDALGTGTVKQGTTFKLGSYYYVVTADATITANEADFSIYPALREAVADDAALTKVDHSAAGSENLIFHPDAFGLAIRPLAPMLAGSGVNQQIVTDPDTGLSLRVSFQSSAIGGAGVAMTESIVVDILAGATVLQPDYACRLTGQV